MADLLECQRRLLATVSSTTEESSEVGLSAVSALRNLMGWLAYPVLRNRNNGSIPGIYNSSHPGMDTDICCFADCTDFGSLAARKSWRLFATSVRCPRVIHGVESGTHLLS
jgi:hypothetical protein